MSAGIPLLDDLPLVHEDQAVAHFAGELHLVRDDDHRHAGPCEVAHDDEHLASSGSRADVTSSNSITCGSMTSARAIATRLLVTADSWCGYDLSSPGGPRGRAARAHAPRPRGGSLFTRRAPRVRLSITRRCGKRLNCWKTMPIRCRTLSTLTPRLVISSPSKKIRPLWIGSRRLIVRRRVLLPLPLGPMTTRVSPWPPRSRCRRGRGCRRSSCGSARPGRPEPHWSWRRPPLPQA